MELKNLKFSKFTQGLLWLFFGFLFWKINEMFGSLILSENSYNQVEIFKILILKNNFLHSSQEFLSFLIASFFSSLFILYLTPKELKTLALKSVMFYTLIISFYKSFFGYSLVYDFLEYIFSFAVPNLIYIVQPVAIVLLILSIVEYFFRKEIPKPILLKRKILLTILLLLIFSLIINFIDYYFYRPILIEFWQL